MKPINDFHKDVVFISGTGDHVDSIGVLPMKYDYLGDDNPVIISCWRVTWRDLLRMIIKRRLWLVMMAKQLPPVFVETDEKYIGIKEYDEMFGGES